MQPEPMSPQDKQESPSTPVEAPRRSSASGILTILLVLAVLLAAGLGFWGYRLSTDLAATKQQLSTLQGEHDQLKKDYAKLQGDNETLNADLSKTRTDFETTKGELTTAQTDLGQSQSENQGLKTKLASAGEKAEILYAFSTVAGAADILEIDAMIQATNDQQLKDKWNQFANSPDNNTSGEILLYLITEVWNDLK